MAILEVRLLGTFNIRLAGQDICITSRPVQSLFAYLALNANTAHRRETLAGLIWPTLTDTAARNNLRHALWRIRKFLGPAASLHYLSVDDLTIKFEAHPDFWLDAATLAQADKKSCANDVMESLSVYQGELLPGFYHEWAALEREHLRAVFDHKMARLMSLLQDENRWLDILDWGERWIKFGQKPEPAYRALMSAHAAKGDMSKVAATYERCLCSLREIGVEPSLQTISLYESLKSTSGISIN